LSKNNKMSQWVNRKRKKQREKMTQKTCNEFSNFRRVVHCSYILSYWINMDCFCFFYGILFKSYQMQWRTWTLTAKESCRMQVLYNAEYSLLMVFNSWLILLSYHPGRAIAEAVSRWLPTAAARVQSQVWSSGICGGQSGAGAGFLRVLRFPLPFIPPNSPSSQSPGAGTIGQ
jgi:hypothetical protein